MNQQIERNSAGIPLRPLGKTGVKVSIIGFGGGHFVRPTLDEQASVKLVHAAIDAGVTFMDTAWEYHNGESERRMGVALHDRREKVTLMTKVCARDRKTAEEQLHDSLRRLQTDVIDIWQFHEVNYDNDPDWIFQPDGAIEAAVAAQQAGKIRFIGFTGHKSPHILQKMLAHDFAWDTCQFPVNVPDAHYRSFQTEFLPQVNRREIGVIAMKSLGGAGQMITSLGLTAQQCRHYTLRKRSAPWFVAFNRWKIWNRMWRLPALLRRCPVKNRKRYALKFVTKRPMVATNGLRARSVSTHSTIAISMAFLR